MKITLISASMNEPSNSDFLGNIFADALRKHDTEVVKYRLRDLDIKQFTLDHYDPVCHQEEDFCKIQDDIESSHGLVIATPVWNFSVPAVLKNLIDRFGSFALDETRSQGTLKGLPFYLIFTGGAPLPAWKGLMQKTTSSVPQALQYFDASYMGHHFEPKCTQGRGKFGLVVDERPESIEAIKVQAEDFVKVVKEYKETGKPPAAKAARNKIMQLGERFMKKFF